MANIKFWYKYRDGANYKNHEAIVFDNPDNIDIVELEKLIHSKLISDTWFYVDEWGLPDLHFTTWDNELDHSFHEFDSVEYTCENGDNLLSLNEFMVRLRNKEQG
jgi:hypothetical protein